MLVVNLNPAANANDEWTKIEDVLPLISAWGTAIENGKNPAQHFQKLVCLRETDAETLELSLNFAEAYQRALNNRYAEEPLTSPSHPFQRLARVILLRNQLSLN